MCECAETNLLTMTIDEIINERKPGLLYNKLYKYEAELQLHKNLGDIYQLAKDIINSPKKYKSIIKKLKSYETNTM